ncbi:MAG TPA: glycosyltransferase family 1 protein [Solirubrobacter sp.]
MRIAYEETGFELDAAGSARAARGLREALRARDDVELLEIAQPGSGGGRVRRGLERELTWFPWRLPRAARSRGADLLHCPMPLAPPVPFGLPTVVTVGDALPWTNPEWMTRAHALHARLVMRGALRRAAAVIVPSQYTRSQLVAAVGGLDAARVHVTPWGLEPQFTPGPGPAGRGPYLLTVGTLQPRKNLEGALAAFERLDDAGHRLLVVGASGWREDELRARLDASPARERVELLGRVSDEELVTLYRGAACLLFPSLAEGFGLPLTEAMACGTPVVAADAGSLPEVAGGAAALADPHDPDALAAAVRDVLAHREAWRARGLERAATFTWAACAEATVDVYREVTARTRRIAS